MFRNPKLYKLSNGIRVLLDSLPNFESTALYIMVGAGSRNESESGPRSEFGISHALEHMMFKGTQKRTSEEIIQETAACGGLINAYTSYNLTAYHIMLLQDNLDFALDIMSDIFLNSMFPAGEFEKEKSVIVQEILSYIDNPQAQAEELLGQAVFRGGLAHDVAGTIESVVGIAREDLVDYKADNYSPENTIISLSGAGISDAPATLVKLEKFFGGWKAGKAPRDYIRTSYEQGFKRKDRPDLEHTYLKVAWQSGNALDRRRNLHAKIFANIVGQGMHSRLYREVRDKLNLVYFIGMGNTAFEDVGLMQIDAQTMPENVQAVFDATARIIRDLPANPITREELGRTKAIMKAAKTIAMEDPLRRADSFASELLMFGNMRESEEFLKDLEETTIDDVMAVAKDTLGTLPSVTTYGAPHDVDLEETAKKFIP
ncbi:MAG: insulinase family protein [Rickettsiales bacterium]|jgi:predicted Zn-dependent peptidase|nr:insulinase family protein [Rickettsiales bacterium]